MAESRVIDSIYAGGKVYRIKDSSVGRILNPDNIITEDTYEQMKEDEQIDSSALYFCFEDD